MCSSTPYSLLLDVSASSVVANSLSSVFAELGYLGLVSSWMGDRLITLGLVGFPSLPRPIEFGVFLLSRVCSLLSVTLFLVFLAVFLFFGFLGSCATLAEFSSSLVLTLFSVVVLVPRVLLQPWAVLGSLGFSSSFFRPV